jgi:hypothetical protein
MMEELISGDKKKKADDEKDRPAKFRVEDM